MQAPRSIRPAGSFEYTMWLFTRFSGLALLLFGAISMGAAFMLGGRMSLDMHEMYRWIFFPNPNHVVNTRIPDVSQGWSNAFWQIYSMVMIFMAGTHGLNGVRMVLEDYLERPLLVAVMRTLIFSLWISALIVSIYVILAS